MNSYQDYKMTDPNNEQGNDCAYSPAIGLQQLYPHLLIGPEIKAPIKMLTIGIFKSHHRQT